MFLNTPAPAILLIENDSVTLELYQRELRKSFTVFAFIETNGVLETLKSRDIRAVVIEPEVQSGQGWDLIHSLQTAFPERQLPVIICTTRDPCNLDSGREVAKYLTKPVLPKTFREITCNILGMKDTLVKYP